MRNSEQATSAFAAKRAAKGCSSFGSKSCPEHRPIRQIHSHSLRVVKTLLWSDARLGICNFKYLNFEFDFKKTDM
jgi:hypothetical protein